MLDSARAFNVKVRTVFKFCLRQQLFAFKELHGKEIVRYLRNYKRHEVDQGHSKRLLYLCSYGVLQEFSCLIFRWLLKKNTYLVIFNWLIKFPCLVSITRFYILIFCNIQWILEIFMKNDSFFIKFLTKASLKYTNKKSK